MPIPKQDKIWYDMRERFSKGGAADMRKSWIGALALAAAFFLLSGCSFSSPEDLYAVPRAAEDYKNLQEQIDKVRSAGAEYAGPLSGNYTQPVQLIDLDGDGIQEAVAFFRITAGDDSAPQQIYIYRQTQEGNYEVWNTIPGDGTSINAISYEDLDGYKNPGGAADKELVVSWRLSDKIFLLKAYSLKGPEVEELLPAVSCTDNTLYTLIDMDMDNQKEIVILNLKKDPLDYQDGQILSPRREVSQADYYDYQDGQMVLRGSAPMSNGIEGLAGDTRSNYVRDGGLSVPALFVTSNLSTGVITDIFALRDGALVNITLNPTTGISNSTFRLNNLNNIAIRDIDGDSYLEVPRPTAFPEPRPTGGAENFWSVQWVQYDLAGNANVAATTYYNGEDGWYLILPEAWQGRISLARQDNSGSGERGVLFYPYAPGEEGANAEARPFLAIYRLTGPNQVARAHAGNRFILLEQDDAIYAAEFLSNSGWDCGVDQETLAGLFHLTF